MSRLGSKLWLVLVVVCGLLGASGPAAAQGFDPLGSAEEAAKEPLSADEAAAQERLERLQERMGKDKVSRVIVLPWPDTRVDFRDVGLQTVVRNRIGRAGAKFQPDIDLYQEGRRRRTSNGEAASIEDQPGRVPDDVLASVRRRIDDARKKLGRSTSNAAVAASLLPLTEEVWFNDRVETRQVLFDLYLTIGQATFNAREQTPPYFQMIGSEHNNYYLYMAAAMLWEEREAGVEIVSKRKPGGELGAYLDDIVQLIGDGIHAPIPLAFNDRGVFDAKKFTSEYKVVINGIERIVDPDGIVLAPRGRVDLSLERADGFSLSERTDVLGLDEKLYFPMEVARSKLGYDLLNQLMEHPEECAPELSPETLAAIATYASLHPGDEVFLAIPKGGSVRDVYVWRWDPFTLQLAFMLDANQGFPIRFALLAGTGITFGGLVLDEQSAARATRVGSASSFSLSADDFLSPVPSAIPIDFQLRAHYSRLMLGFGVTFSKNIAADSGGVWTDRYQADGGAVVQPTQTLDGNALADPDGNLFEVTLKQRDFQRSIHGMIGVFLLKDAAAGIGPRGYVQVGWHNVPHALEFTGHLGMTTDATFGKKEYKRVAPLLDADLFAGALVPFGDTIFRSGSKDKPIVAPTFGITIGAGITF